MRAQHAIDSVGGNLSATDLKVLTANFATVQGNYDSSTVSRMKNLVSKDRLFCDPVKYINTDVTTLNDITAHSLGVFPGGAA